MLINNTDRVAREAGKNVLSSVNTQEHELAKVGMRRKDRLLACVWMQVVLVQLGLSCNASYVSLSIMVLETTDRTLKLNRASQ